VENNTHRIYEIISATDTSSNLRLKMWGLSHVCNPISRRGWADLKKNMPKI
jgi:hypothetical protein